jgi:hypothetical protein
MVKNLAQKIKQVERLEPLEPLEVKPKTRKVYLVITLAYEYEPKPKRKFLNKK